MDISTKRATRDPKLSRSQRESLTLFTTILLPNPVRRVDDLVKLLPKGVALSHARGMVRFLEKIERVFLRKHSPGTLIREYVRLAVRDHIEPRFREIFSADEEAVEWIMRPERRVCPQYGEFFVRNPSVSMRLWNDVDRYFGERFRQYAMRKNIVSSLFLYSHGHYSKAVEMVTLALFEEVSMDFFRENRFGIIVRTVKEQEACLLVRALAVCGVPVEPI